MHNSETSSQTLSGHLPVESRHDDVRYLTRGSSFGIDPVPPPDPFDPTNTISALYQVSAWERTRPILFPRDVRYLTRGGAFGIDPITPPDPSDPILSGGSWAQQAGSFRSGSAPHLHVQLINTRGSFVITTPLIHVAVAQATQTDRVHPSPSRIRQTDWVQDSAWIPGILTPGFDPTDAIAAVTQLRDHSFSTPPFHPTDVWYQTRGGAFGIDPIADTAFDPELGPGIWGAQANSTRTVPAQTSLDVRLIAYRALFGLPSPVVPPTAQALGGFRSLDGGRLDVRVHQWQDTHGWLFLNIPPVVLPTGMARAGFWQIPVGDDFFQTILVTKGD